MTTADGLQISPSPPRNFSETRGIPRVFVFVPIISMPAGGVPPRRRSRGSRFGADVARCLRIRVRRTRECPACRRGSARVAGARRDDSDDIVGQVDIGAPRAPRAPGSVIRFCRGMPRPAPSHDRRDGGVGRVALRGPTGREATATCERERRHASRCCTGRRGKRPLPSEDRAGGTEPRTGVRWSLCRGRPPSLLRVRTNCQRRRCLIPCSGLSQFLGLPCQFL